MNLLGSARGRTVLFTCLYASEGAPIGFIWWALPTLLRSQGEDLQKITQVTALLVLPWALKFLWAPLVDCLRGPRFGFRAWIIGAQAVMGLSLLPLIQMELSSETLPWWTLLLFVHAGAAATQDVAVDGLAVRCVPEHERGRITGCMQAGMLLGRSVFAGGTLWLAEHLAIQTVLIFLAAWIWSTLTLLLWVREPALESGTEGKWREFGSQLSSVLHLGSTWRGIGFALTAGAAFETVGMLAGSMMLDHGATKGGVGIFFALVSVPATLVGSLLGGFLSDRLGRTRSLRWFLIGLTGAVLGLAATERSWIDVTVPVLMAWVGLVYLFIGLFTAGSYAWFMDLTNKKLGATQFSAFMAATNGCEAWSGRTGGWLAGLHGYAASFAAMSVVSLASLALLRRSRRPRINTGE